MMRSVPNGEPYDEEREKIRLLGRDAWRREVADAKIRTDDAVGDKRHVLLVDGNAHRSGSQVNTLALIRLYSARQTAALGLFSPRTWTNPEDRVFFGCVIISCGAGDFLIAHGARYCARYTCNVLVAHDVRLLCDIRIVGNMIQFPNGHTYFMTPFDDEFSGGIRYSEGQFPRVKVLKIKLGMALSRGPEADPWSLGSPVDLGPLPVDISRMPEHLQTSISESGCTWQEHQQW